MSTNSKMTTISLTGHMSYREAKITFISYKRVTLPTSLLLQLLGDFLSLHEPWLGLNPYAEVIKNDS